MGPEDAVEWNVLLKHPQTDNGSDVALSSPSSFNYLKNALFNLRSLRSCLWFCHLTFMLSRICIW